MTKMQALKRLARLSKPSRFFAKYLIFKLYAIPSICFLENMCFGKQSNIHQVFQQSQWRMGAKSKVGLLTSRTRPLIDPARRPVFTVLVMSPATAKNQANQG